MIKAGEDLDSSLISVQAFHVSKRANFQENSSRSWMMRLEDRGTADTGDIGDTGLTGSVNNLKN